MVYNFTEGTSMRHMMPDMENFKMLGWNLPPEHQSMLHPHWSNYPAPPYFAHLLLALVYCILMLVSVFGNTLVVWVFSTSKSLQTSSNMLILNLAIFDIVMLLELPMLIANSFVERMLGWEAGCQFYAALGSVSGIGAAMTNAAIAYDRYKTISSPYTGRLSKPQVLIIVAITWLWTVPFTVFPILEIWGRYIPEGYLTTCSFDYLTKDSDTRIFVGSIFAWAYVFPMFLIVISYGKLFGHVQAHEQMLREQAKKMNVASLQTNKDVNSQSTEIRIAKAAFLIFFLFVCAWTPYAIVALTGSFGDQELLTPFYTMIPAVCAKTVSCLDPWVYAMSHPKYRQELEKRVPWLGITEKATPSDATSNSGTIATTVPDKDENSC